MQHMDAQEANGPLDIPENYLDEWQDIIDLTARLIKVPAALIMRVSDQDLEVYVTSHTNGNPYKVGDKEHLWDSGLYCETVLNTQGNLLVSNARQEKQWKNNPDIKLGMISYLGYPINFPTGKPFGTICVLDNKANSYSAEYVALLAKMRDLVESQLGLIYMNSSLKNENLKLNDYIAEIKTLRGLIPICAHCKRIKDGKGYWKLIELYLEEHTEAEFTHGLCPECMKGLYPELGK